MIRGQRVSLSGEDCRGLTSSRWIPWLGSCIVPSEAECREIEEREGDLVEETVDKCWKREARIATIASARLVGHVAGRLHLSYR